MELKKLVLVKMNESLSLGDDDIHRYQDMYWLDGMKREIADYVAKYPNCQ